LHLVLESTSFLSEARVLPVVERLLSAGADPTLANDERKTPLGFANRAKSKALRGLFKASPAKPSFDDEVLRYARDAVDALHNAGILTQVKCTPEATLVARLEKRLGAALEPKDAEQFIRLLALDGKRAFLEPLWDVDEIPPLETSRYYSACLKSWAAISLGAFTPKKIEEHWSGGAIELCFETGGTRHVIKPRASRAFDLSILVALNQIIAPSKRRFIAFLSETISTVVLCVTDEELNVIERASELRFEDDEGLASLQRDDED
jgi:hypothetical protein